MQFESPLPHKKTSVKVAPVAAFIFNENNSVNTVSTKIRYTTPEIIRSEHGWYIKYKYEIPHAIRPLYDGQQWFTFRLKKNINRFKGSDREKFAVWLCEQIHLSLQQGYNPFDADEQLEAESTTPILTGQPAEATPAEPSFLEARKALWFFLEQWKKRGLDDDSYAKYERYVGRLIEWLIKKGLQHTDIKKIKQETIEDFLHDNRVDNEISNRESNNTLTFINTAFLFLQKKKIIDNNPCKDIEKLKANTTKHRFYDDTTLDVITKALLARDAYTHFAFQCVYYLCVRADEELQQLKCRNIFWQQDKMLLEFGKGKAQRYVPMDANIKKILMDRNIHKAPGDYYVFGLKGQPSAEGIGRGFFAKRFRKVRDAIELDHAYTLYGAKHTRVVHLKYDGVSDADIMALTGHKDFTAYAKYLRDLGMTADVKNINSKSRKVG